MCPQSMNAPTDILVLATIFTGTVDTNDGVRGQNRFSPAIVTDSGKLGQIDTDAIMASGVAIKTNDKVFIARHHFEKGNIVSLTQNFALNSNKKKDVYIVFFPEKTTTLVAFIVANAPNRKHHFSSSSSLPKCAHSLKWDRNR